MCFKVLSKVGSVNGGEFLAPRLVHLCLTNCKGESPLKRISQLAVLLLSASAGFGQTVLATVTGTITDQAGAVVANAPVSLKNVETGQTYAAASSAAGNYTVTQLPIGDYTLTVAVPGFRTYAHEKFHLSAGQ